MSSPRANRASGASLRRRVLSLGAGLALLVPATMSALPVSAGADPLSAGGVAGAVSDEVAQSVPYAPLEYVPAAPNPAVPEEYEQVKETPSLRLYVNKGDSKIIIEDKRNGKLWSSNPLTPLADQKSLLDDAVFLINYTNARRQMTNLASSGTEKPAVTFQNTANGFRATYDLQKLRVKLIIDYALKEEPAAEGGRAIPYLEVTVPDKGVEETGDCAIATSTTCSMVTSVELLPLLGAAPVGAEGYLMVPDEGGAITTFKAEYPQYKQRYSAPIYGTDAAQQAFTFGGGGSGQVTTSRARMPIWGLKEADSAYAAIVTKGEYQANINEYLAGYITAANRGSVEFVFRRQASIPRRKTQFVNRIETDILPGDRQVRYVFLQGDDADYSGMATAYRDYLLKDKGLKRLPKTPPRPLVDFYMGVTRRTSFREDFVPMTTFDQGIEMLQALLDRGVSNFDVELQGWNDAGDRGYWPRRYPAENTLGGNAGLRRFTDFAHKHGIRVVFFDNYVYGLTQSSGGIIGQIPYVRNIWPAWSYGFNSRSDTIRGVNKLPVYNSSGRSQGLYLLNPVIARTRYAERDMPTHKAMGADGLSLNIMGNILMSDTNTSYPLTREQVANEWGKIAAEARQNLGVGVMQGPYAYVFDKSDYIYDAPVDSRDAFGDTPVPVYHIALNGLKTRFTINGNLRNDPKTEFLRQIEWGMQPSYMLSHQPSSDLIRTTANRLYSSQWTDWIDPAAQEYKRMQDEFGYLNGLFITKHETIAPRVNRTTYEDGSTLTVNYNPDPYSGPDGAVSPYGYVLRKGGGR